MIALSLPDLEQIAAHQVADLLALVGVGESLPLDSSADLCDTLELFIPQLLRRDHSEWEEESIDGFFFSSARRTGAESVALIGTCILISDQTVTPVVLDLCVSGGGQLQSIRIRLGEPGHGPLGISGPMSSSRSAREMLAAIAGRVDRVRWVYDVSVERTA